MKHRVAWLCLAAVWVGCNGGGAHDASSEAGDAHDAFSPLQMCLANQSRDAGMDAHAGDADVDAAPDVVDVAPSESGADGGSPRAVQLALGDQFSCARISNGTVRCWGVNTDGEMADGTTASHLTATAIPGIGDAVDVIAGGRHVCVRRASGAVSCWGRDVEGQLGLGVARVMPVLPTPVPCLDGATSVGLGGATSCARTTTGETACWGANDYGEIGDGTMVDRGSPTVVPLADVASLALGDSHSCARLADGTVRCWGDDTFGQVGSGAASMTVASPAVVLGVGGVVEIAAGGFHTCALRRNGTIRCWGHNNAGQLGDGTMNDQSTPVDVIGIAGATQLALGAAHSCAVLGDGSVSCWGWNQSGQLGNAVSAVEPMPTAVAGLANVSQIATGGQHTCALTSMGVVFCWGNNQHGQLGDGTHNLQTMPVMITVGG